MATRQGLLIPRRFICERQMTGEFDSYNTPHHDSQMGASSGRICHHNGNAERGWVEERRFDKCVMHAPVTAAAIREQRAAQDDSVSRSCDRVEELTVAASSSLSSAVRPSRWPEFKTQLVLGLPATILPLETSSSHPSWLMSSMFLSLSLHRSSKASSRRPPSLPTLSLLTTSMFLTCHSICPTISV
ncbi:unnamed protein product [Pleuronectes platessa]|uniref:Uncharacterized protein n=1 Tax=Pleuronectes platessa TaxID=8262 RepID=A0A9N7W2J2_PLEPL|nr:unnamed protein product [Pleuronectes platessa]